MNIIKRKCLECGMVFDSSDWKKEEKETGTERAIKGIGRFLRISQGGFNPINPDVVTGRTGQNVQAMKMVYGCPNCGSMKTTEINEGGGKNV